MLGNQIYCPQKMGNKYQDVMIMFDGAEQSMGNPSSPFQSPTYLKFKNEIKDVLSSEKVKMQFFLRYGIVRSELTRKKHLLHQ